MIIALGELGTSLLEAVARSGLFDRIVLGSRSRDKAEERANNARAGAGIEGFFPVIEALELDAGRPDFAARLRDERPDYIFTAPSLLPWWKLDPGKPALPFAACTALHLAPMARFRDRIAEAGVAATWIGASYPDVINAVLNRSGFGPDCGIGNVQEPIPKIRAGVARRLGCAPQDVSVRMVAQHAFEYFVLNRESAAELPPHLLQVSVGGRDVTALAETVLREPYPFPYDLHFNRVTASAGLAALRALTSEAPVPAHLPGIGRLVGGYPVRASRAGIALDLAPGWTPAQAAAVNEASLPWDGIDSVEPDGTIVFSGATRDALRALLGRPVETLAAAGAGDQARALLAAL